MKNKIRALALLAVLTTLFSGCTVHRLSGTNGGYSSLKNKTVLLKNKLSSHNIKVEEDADKVTLKLSNSILFNKKSANFTPGAYKRMNLIVAYTKQVEWESVSVIGYPATSQEDIFGDALAKGRAERIARYLLRSGINTNFIYADNRSSNTKLTSKDFIDGVLVVIKK